jgi:hypothetical protein
MRYVLLVLLPILVALAVPGSAAAQARYPFCPPKVGDRTLTSTSQRGDEVYPQIVCWYENKQPAYEFHAGWAAIDEGYEGSDIGCGRPNDDPDKKIISLTHQAYVATNWSYQTMPGFEPAIDDFLDQLETDFAEPCKKVAEALRFNITGKQGVPAKPSKEFCENKKCEAADDATLKICNQTNKVHKPYSKSPGNKFGPVKVKPGKCYKRKLQLPAGKSESTVSLGDGAAKWVFLIHLSDPFNQRPPEAGY